MQHSRFSVVLVLALLIVPVARPAAGQMPPAPKPGPEHELFKMDEGTWDAVVELMGAPGAPPMTSKGVEANTIGCGGLCLISDFKGEMAGATFHGHGVVSWDPVKKKYVGSWTDSMSQGMGISETTYDAAKKTWAGTMESRDMTGTMIKTRSVGENRPDGTRVFTMYAPGPDGKEMHVMRMTLTKRK